MILVCLTQYSAISQVTLNLIVNPNPPARLAEWSARPGIITLIVTNIGASKTLQINSILSDASGVVAAATIAGRPRLITIQSGITVLQASDVVPLNVMQFGASYYGSFLKTGKLPQGSYQLCVRLDSAGITQATTQTQCRGINLVGLQLPFLLTPMNEQVLPARSAQNAIIFRWSNALRSGTDQPVYHVEVYEILAGQQPVQAMRSNMPLLNASVTGTTQYTWRPQLLFNDNLVHRFIWTIRTTDSQGNLIAITDGSPEGRSEPKEFSVESEQATERRKIETIIMIVAPEERQKMEDLILALPALEKRKFTDLLNYAGLSKNKKKKYITEIMQADPGKRIELINKWVNDLQPSKRKKAELTGVDST